MGNINCHMLACGRSRTVSHKSLEPQSPGVSRVLECRIRVLGIRFQVSVIIPEPPPHKAPSFGGKAGGF